MKWIEAILIVIVLSALIPIALIVEWISEQVLTITLKLMECFPNIDS